MASPPKNIKKQVASEKFAEEDENDVTSTSAARKAKGRPKAKAKGKAKGKKLKGKATKTTKVKDANEEGGPAEGEDPAEDQPKSKAKPKGLKNIVMAEIQSRDIGEVMAEAKAEVDAAEAAIVAAELEEKGIESEMEQIKRDLDAASARAGAVMQKETVALEKLKAVRAAKLESAQAVVEADAGREDASKQLMILELELNSRGKVQEFEQQRKDAQDAIEAAKKALEDAKQREKECADLGKTAMAEQRAKEIDLLKEKAEREIENVASSRQDSKASEKEAAKKAAAAMKEIEKMRLDREKGRQQIFKEAAGLVSLGKGRGMMKRALEDAPLEPVGKAARTIEDVD